MTVQCAVERERGREIWCPSINVQAKFPGIIIGLPSTLQPLARDRSGTRSRPAAASLANSGPRHGTAKSNPALTSAIIGRNTTRPKLQPEKTRRRDFDPQCPRCSKSGVAGDMWIKFSSIHRLSTTVQHHRTRLSTRHAQVHQQPSFAVLLATSSVEPSRGVLGASGRRVVSAMTYRRDNRCERTFGGRWTPDGRSGRSRTFRHGRSTQ